MLRVKPVVIPKPNPSILKRGDWCRDVRALFRIDKQRAGEKRSIVGVSCLKDESGVVKVSVDD